MKYDLVVVTAANKAQARGFRAQLKGRKNFVVVPDPGDRRVGSLGATVNVLRRFRKLTPPSRILICHSGGDAKRTPAFSAQGKAFVPMRDRRPLLDHIISEMEKLPARKGVTICCGDVIPYLDSKKVTFAAKGVTGVAYPDGPWQAQRHGVYIKGEGGVGTKEGERRKDVVWKVGNFLQKPKVRRGKFLIDTGILHFDWSTAQKMMRLPIAGDVYEEFPKMLLGGFAPFFVSVVPTCEFFHIGSSRELLKLLGTNGRLIESVQAPIGHLGGQNIVTNLPACYGEVNLAKGECLTALPLGKKEWYYLKYRVTDTFKEDGLWEKYSLGEKMRRVNHARLIVLKNPPKK